MSRESVEIKGEMATMGNNRYANLPKPFKILVICLVTTGIILFLLYTFGWSIRGWVLEGTRYYYLLYLCFATCVFICVPARKKDSNRILWYDLILASVVFGTFAYFTANAYSITIMGWVPPKTTHDLVLATVIALIALEASRRMTGWAMVAICLIFGIYSLIASYMPGILYGFSFPFPNMIGTFAYGGLGLLGMPAQVTGEILIAFLIFAGVLMSSGAGTFFLNISLALLGRFRGGPAKVAVVSSGLFGSLSGTVVPNIITTGSITIPTMKRIGYPPHYAGAIEAVASSGGSIMPPVMGIIIFVMVVLTEIPYSTIMVAALIPAILYYYGLLVQVDAYAAKVGLRGLPREELPSIWKTLLQGWPYILVLAFLIFGLIYMRWDVKAPIYAAGLLFVISQELNNGHLYVELEDLKEKSITILELDKDEVALKVKTAFHNLYDSEKIKLITFEEKHFVTLSQYYFFEKGVANKVLKLAQRKSNLSFDIDAIYKNIRVAQNERDIALNEDQQAGILSCLQNKVSVVTGGPGTGKTTLITTFLG